MKGTNFKDNKHKTLTTMNGILSFYLNFIAPNIGVKPENNQGNLFQLKLISRTLK